MTNDRAEICPAMKDHRGCDLDVAPEASPRRPGKGSRAKLVSRYRAALRDYLRHTDNRRLQSAYDLGCVALRCGMGVFDMARLHEETLAKALTTGGSARESEQQARAAETFLLDALSPFEAARRALSRYGGVARRFEFRRKLGLPRPPYPSPAHGITSAQ